MDFYAKSRGKGSVTTGPLRIFPLGISTKYKNELYLRVLLMNCISVYYSKLWDNIFKVYSVNTEWSKQDPRLLDLSVLTKVWNKDYYLKNYYERYWCQIEIDVIVAISFGISLKELIEIYNIQFPVLKDYNEDTWFDKNGDIVFTKSKGLNGVGVDRPVWKTIKDMKEGESYEHTIEKSELYYGEKVTYYAPFEKCDRVEDYKVAWAHFEKIFNQN